MIVGFILSFASVLNKGAFDYVDCVTPRVVLNSLWMTCHGHDLSVLCFDCSCMGTLSMVSVFL